MIDGREDREPSIGRPVKEHTPESLSESMPADVAVDLTSELRWFFDGPLPAEVLTWFQGSGDGFVEDRSDTYRLDRHVDTGVKRRYRATLELKRRLEPPEPFTCNGMDGRLEVWKRWSPAEGRVRLDDSTTWVDVDKTVIKRRFERHGRELPLDEQRRAMVGDGCDVEIAAISVNALRGWTFALAAFGATEHHRSLLTSTLEALARGRPNVRDLGLDHHRSCGYPEWLTRVASIPATSDRPRQSSSADGLS